MDRSQGKSVGISSEQKKKQGECSTGDLRRVFRHQQRDIDMLYSPFPPIRLFQKVDMGYIEHLYKHAATSPEVV